MQNNECIVNFGGENPEKMVTLKTRLEDNIKMDLSNLIRRQIE
jgi:hypothetical protein